MRYSNDETVNKVVKDLLSEGCAIEPPHHGRHYKVVFPNGHKLPIPGSVKDARSGLNFRALARQIIAKGGLNGNRQA